MTNPQPPKELKDLIDKTALAVEEILDLSASQAPPGADRGFLRETVLVNLLAKNTIVRLLEDREAGRIEANNEAMNLGLHARFTAIRGALDACALYFTAKVQKEKKMQALRGGT